MSEVIKFSRMNPSGKQIPEEGIFRIGHAKQYSIQLESGNDLETAFDLAKTGQPLSDQQADLIWSFCHSWLIVRKTGLAKNVPTVVTLPPSVIYLQKIGRVGRFFDSVGKYSLLAAEIGLVLETSSLMADLVFLEEGASLGEELAVKGSLISLDLGILVASAWDKSQLSVVERFGNPGDPVYRKQFDAQEVFALINLSTVRKILLSFPARYDGEILARMLTSLELQLVQIFLSVSRQLNGLLVAGQAEVSSAIATFSALSVGLANRGVSAGSAIQTPSGQKEGPQSICQFLESAVESWPENWRLEGKTCLKYLAEAMEQDFDLAEIQMDRNLTLSMGAEVAECVTYPAGAVFRLLGSTAGALGKFAPSKSNQQLFSSAEKGMKEVASAVEKSPGTVTKAARGGVAVETWVRSLLKKSWWAGQNENDEKRI